MKIELEIPHDIVKQCRELGINDVNIPFIFEDYCKDRLGYYVALTGTNFKYWASDDENIADWIPIKTTKAFVEVKMVVEIEMDETSTLEDAIKEMSENIATSDLISSNGCIVGGNIDEYIIQKIDKS